MKLVSRRTMFKRGPRAGSVGLDCSPDRNPVAYGVGPESDGPNGGQSACPNKRGPKGCKVDYLEECVLGESQIGSRLPPASVAETAARTASLD